MKYKFWLKVSGIIFWVSFVFWIVESAYFGWNTTAQSKYETWCDNAANIGILAAFIIRIEVICSYVVKYHIEQFLPKSEKPCDGNCGMSYCDENGCIERKRISTDLEDDGMNKPDCN